jgi:hypothetical protein
MSDRTERMLEQARADAMRDVVPPGVDRIRRTVGRRRTVATVAGAVLLTALTISLTVLIGRAGPPASSSSQGAYVEPSSSPSLIPQPDPAMPDRMEVAAAALGNPDTTPWTMATAGMVSGDYENHVNDIPEGDYHLYVFCIGEGSVQVVVKAQNAGDFVLATGSVPCAETPVPAELSVHQPISGYLRVYLSGDGKANAGAAFAFKFVNKKGEQLFGSRSPS